MRLWHESLIPHLPRQQLLGLHREVCGLRGLGWGKKHSTVDYVFQHPYGWLVAYHFKVMEEMLSRGYTPNLMWWRTCYRGESLPELKGNSYIEMLTELCRLAAYQVSPIYPEHNDAYLQECLENLERKGIHIEL